MCIRGRWAADARSSSRRADPDDGATGGAWRECECGLGRIFPVLFAPCESVDPAAIGWLLEHGAHPNCPDLGSRITALDYLIGTYARSAELPKCIDLLVSTGGGTRYDVPGVLEILRDRVDLLAAQLDAKPKLVNWRFPELDVGSTGGRRLTLRGATLLHVAAEFGNVTAASLLLE